MAQICAAFLSVILIPIVLVTACVVNQRVTHTRCTRWEFPQGRPRAR